MVGSKSHARVNRNYNQGLTVSEMDSEGFKVLYKGFKSQKKPIDMIAKFGFNPDAVIAEYQRFRQLNETDYDDLLSQIVVEVEELSYYNEKIKVIVDKYKSRGTLTTIETIQLLELWLNTEVKSRVELIFTDPGLAIPGQLRRWRCSKCRSQIPDGIINPNLPFGKYVLEKYSKSLVCGFCLDDKR
jgi:hypothetical protein